MQRAVLGLSVSVESSELPALVTAEQEHTDSFDIQTRKWGKFREICKMCELWFQWNLMKLSYGLLQYMSSFIATKYKVRQ